MGFVVKKKTADDVRISDWSADVCSSDLPCLRLASFMVILLRFAHREGRAFDDAGSRFDIVGVKVSHLHLRDFGKLRRSEERRVVNERVSTCRYQWSP